MSEAPSFIWTSALTDSAEVAALIACSVKVRRSPFMLVAEVYIRAPFEVLTSKLLMKAPERSQLPDTSLNLLLS